MPVDRRTTAASSPRSPARSPPTTASTSPRCASSASWLAGHARRRRGDDQRPHRRGVLAARPPSARQSRASWPTSCAAACRSSRRSSAKASPTPPSTRARRARPARWRSTSCRRTIGCASASRRATRSQYFDAIHRAAPGLDLVCHVYPAWTRASYSSQLLADLARLPYVQAFKVGPARHEQVRARHRRRSARPMRRSRS